MKHEFYGTNLESTMKAATGSQDIERQRKIQECDRIVNEISRLAGDANSLERDLDGLLRTIEVLRNSRADALNTAALSAVTAASGGIGTAINVLRNVRKTMRVAKAGRGLSALDALSFVPIVGGIATAILSLNIAARHSRAITSAVSRAERLKAESERLSQRSSGLIRAAFSNGCDRL